MIRNILYTCMLALCLLPGTADAAGYNIPDSVVRTHFTFYMDNPRHLDQADSVLTGTRQQLIELLGDSLSYNAKVYVLEDLQAFEMLIRGLFPDWGAAAAFPQRGLIAIKSPDKFNIRKPLNQLLAHEYTHLAVADMAGINRVPRWFDEGMAMFISTEWGWSDNLAMGRVGVFGDFIPLMEIEQVNRFGEGKAHVAYSQSYLAVKYMVDNYGKGSLSRFLREIGRGRKVDAALTTATGSNFLEFQEEFNQHLAKQFNLITVFMDTMVLWLGLAVIVVIGAFMRYRKKRSYYKKWEEEEKLHSTDFDYGDPDNPETTDDDGESWRS